MYLHEYDIFPGEPKTTFDVASEISDRKIDTLNAASKMSSSFLDQSPKSLCLAWN